MGENQLLVFESERYVNRDKKPVCKGGDFELERKFDIPCIFNFDEEIAIRWSYSFRRPSNLPQKALFIARPQELRR
jgi:hypothetical protein